MTEAERMPLLTLPTGRLLLASTVGPLGVGIVWLLVGGFLCSPETGLTGLWSGIVVAAVGVVADLLMTPWRPRPATSWMNRWILHSILRIGGTIGLVILLYFASSPDPANLLFSYLACFLVGLAWGTGVWTESLRKSGQQTARSQQAE